MNNPEPPEQDQELSNEDFLSAMFVNLVMQQSNMALMFLGKAPHPETGEVIQDLDTAKYFIDQLEMLEAKTKGNLNRKEEQILKQGMTMLRLAYVEAIGGGGESATAAPSAAKGPVGTESPTPALEKPSAATAPKETPTAAPAPPPTAASEAPEESRKKFTKKY